MTRPVRIAPSILAADFARLGAELQAVEAAGADWIHLDVMDGHFVPNLTFGPAAAAALAPGATAPLDVHLMTAPADPWIGPFAEAGAATITIHPEAGPHLHRSLQAIRAAGCRAGVALTPATPPEAVAWVMDAVDLILAMTVNPGFGGQAFIPGQTAKIARLAAMIAETGRPIDLQVDGGITPETAGAVRAAGADVLVAGSAIFGQRDYSTAITALRAAAESGQPGPANPPAQPEPRPATGGAP